MVETVELSTRRLLLERDSELAAILTVIENAREGAGQLVVIEGNAGIGKTRLLHEARASAGKEGFTVLSARGGQLEDEFSFGVVRQLFEPLLATTAREERAELFAGAAALALPLFDEERLASGEQAIDAPYAMLHGLYWLAANLALRSPAMIAVDDLHWADAPSLRWIAYLAARLEGLPLLVVSAARPPEQSAQPELQSQLVADPATVVVRPQPLGEDAVAALVRALTGTEPDASFVSACRTATGGNPLFLRATLETLARDRVAPTAAGTDRVLRIGSKAVSRAVERGLTRLPSETVSFLRAAAVLGDGAPLHQVAALAELNVPTAARAASMLVRAGLLRQEDPVEFFHPVVRTGVYDDIDASGRTSAHRKAGELLLAAGAPPEQAAAHLMLTLPSGDEFVRTTLRRAAERALAQGAPQAAIAYLRRLLREPLSDNDHAGVLRALGHAELHIDAFAAVEHLREALVRTSGAVPRAHAALDYARALLWLDRFDVAADALLTAIDELGDREPELREHAEAVLIGATLWTPELTQLRLERIARVREEQLGRGLGAAIMRSQLAWFEGRRGRSRERTTVLAERALESGLLHGSEAIWALTAACALTLAGELDRAALAYDEAIEEARRRGDLVMLVPLLILRGWLSFQRGDLLAAEEDLRSPELELAQGASTTAAYSAGFLAELYIEQGRMDEAAATLEALRGHEPSHSEYRFVYLYARARLRNETGSPEQALRDLRRVGAEMDAIGARNPSLVPWRSQAALALLALGRNAEARELAAEELALARRWGMLRAIGIALRACGLIEGGQGGEELLREAAETLEGSPARLEHARALVDLGAALRRRNKRSDAQAVLRRGLEVAHLRGARGLVHRAQEELAATGARPRTLVLSGIESLTASERRVARMASEGMTNKAIAQALFVTVKTVELHLGHVYRKLGITSRLQLADALGERGG